jgi:hypothetical protein
MSFNRSALAAAALFCLATLGPALAQATAPAPTTSSKIDDVSKWTTKQWNHAKAEWAKEPQELVVPRIMHDKLRKLIGHEASEVSLRKYAPASYGYLAVPHWNALYR